jgi:hypothetical protein
MVPYYQFRNAMMPTIMADDYATERGSADAHRAAEASESKFNKMPQQAGGYAGNRRPPLAPRYGESAPTTAPFGHCSGVAEAPHCSIPAGSNVVLVPIPIAMLMDNQYSQCHQNTVDLHSPYTYHTGQYQPQLTSMQGSHSQWFGQATPQLSQPTYGSTGSEW